MSQPRGLVVLLAVLLSSFAIVLALGGLFATSRDGTPPGAVEGVSALTLTLDPGALADGAAHDPVPGVRVWADGAATGVTVCVRADAGGWRLRDAAWGTPSRRSGEDARCLTVTADTLRIDLVPR